MQKIALIYVIMNLMMIVITYLIVVIVIVISLGKMRIPNLCVLIRLIMIVMGT